MQKALTDIIRWCPEETREDFLKRYVEPVRYKMKEKIVSIGICGEAESGRRTLLSVLQHSRYKATQILYNGLCVEIEIQPVAMTHAWSSSCVLT